MLRTLLWIHKATCMWWDTPSQATIPLVPIVPPGGPPGVLPRILQQNPGGGVDGYLVRLSGAGHQMQFATYLGGSGPDAAFGVSVRSSRDVYVVGATGSSNFAVTGSSLSAAARRCA